MIHSIPIDSIRGQEGGVYLQHEGSGRVAGTTLCMTNRWKVTLWWGDGWASNEDGVEPGVNSPSSHVFDIQVETPGGGRYRFREGEDGYTLRDVDVDGMAILLAKVAALDSDVGEADPMGLCPTHVFPPTHRDGPNELADGDEGIGHNTEEHKQTRPDLGSHDCFARRREEHLNNLNRKELTAAGRE